jgi:hypothetical protein
MSLGKVELNADGFAIRRDGLVELALLIEHGAETGMSLGIVGLDADRLATSGDGFVEFPVLS